MSGSGFRGVSAAQDGRFSDKDKKLLKSTKFPDSFNTRVDMAKVQLEVIRPWIHQELQKYLGVEDDILKGYVESQLESKPLDPKQMQLSLTGFLEKNTSAFMRDLWDLLLSAQATDVSVNKATRKLFPIANTPQALLDLGLERLERARARCAYLLAWHPAHSAVCGAIALVAVSLGLCLCL
jgi:serine/arginine repetitive matrix protein 1